MGTMTTLELCNLDNGQGARRIIPEARFAVLAQAGDARCLISTHRSLDAAERVLRSSVQPDNPMEIVAIVQ